MPVFGVVAYLNFPMLKGYALHQTVCDKPYLIGWGKI